MLTRQQTLNGYQQILDRARNEGNTQETMRRLLQEDLFFLLVYGLGRADANRDWLYSRCREVQNAPDGYLDLWAREHYKSTIITFAKTIQDILNNPEITIGIFSFTRPIAKAFLKQIKYELETNQRLKDLFPDVLYQNPKSESPRWSEDGGIAVKRCQNPKEATVEAWGLVDGQPTSRHYQLMIYDDVITRESVTTPEMIQKVTEAWELSRNLGAEGGRTRYIGTRYHANDTYATIIERGAAVKRVYPATVDGTTTGTPVLFSVEYLSEKRRDMGPYVFSCQMLQDPKADEAQGFDQAWLKFWQPSLRLQEFNHMIIVDPANEKRKLNDYTAMWDIGLGRDRNFYVFDMIRDRINLTQRTNLLFAWHRRYQPLLTLYERYGMQTDIEHIEYVQEVQNYRFSITEVKGSTPKNDRIRRLIPVFEQGRIYLPHTCFKTNYEGKRQDLVQVFIREEYGPFPVMSHDDMLDGLARIQDPDVTLLWPGGQIQQPSMTQAEKDWAIVTGQAMTDQGAFHIDDGYGDL
jgi:predicted phage terminase large subunit-like protein